MQVFELHFNPKGSDSKILDSFCYEPENIYEKRLGNLYIIGQVDNVLPSKSQFLNNLASLIKTEYYSNSNQSPEGALKIALSKVNEFLAELSKQGEVFWLGNLNLAVLSLKSLSPQPDFILNFTKVGNIKILLSRGEEIMDIGTDLEFQDLQPLPLKIFSNIVGGKLVQNDKILIFTPALFDFFSQRNLIKNLIRVNDEKGLKEFLKLTKKFLEEISGICFFAILKPELSERKIKIREKRGLFWPKINRWLTKTSPTLLKIKTIFSLSTLKSILNLKKIRKKIFTSKNSILAFLVKIRTEFKNFAFSPKPKLIIILALILVSGFFIFKKEREAEFRLAQKSLQQVQAKVALAENFLIFKNEERAFKLFRQAWQEILPLTKTNKFLSATLYKKALDLKKSIEENLFPLSKMEEIQEPEILFDFKEIKFFPQKILALNSDLYFFSPYSPNLYSLKIEKIFQSERNLKLGTTFPDSVLFFSNPNILISFREGKFQQKIIQPPFPNFSFNFLSSFKSNFYFLDRKSGEIAKYPAPNFREKEPLTGKLWLNPQTKKAIAGKSMAIDGSIWILTAENKIDRYYQGRYQQTLKLDLFPPLENPTKIWTSPLHSFLYLLEPKARRIIILTKFGQTIKQYRSEKFNNLLDFAVSKDGKIIYVLNGQKLYQLRTFR